MYNESSSGEIVKFLWLLPPGVYKRNKFGILAKWMSVNPNKARLFQGIFYLGGVILTSPSYFKKN